MDAPCDAVAAVYERCLGPRLIALVVHGSAVTGDAFPDLSNIDFALAIDSPLELEDAVRIAGEFDDIDILPCAYVQATYHQADLPRPSVVPGSFSLLRGALPEGFLHTEASLRSAGVSWLERVAGLIDQDVKDWSVSVARRPRQLRLILTRLKPTVRAHLVRAGDDPISTYSSPWPQLVEAIRSEPTSSRS